MAIKFHTPRVVEFAGPGRERFEHDFKSRVREAGAFVQGFDITATTRLKVSRLRVTVQNVQVSGTVVTGDVLFEFDTDQNRRGGADVLVGIAADVEAPLTQA